jgi:GNAT superfamily N-acetyltransferase
MHEATSAPLAAQALPRVRRAVESDLEEVLQLGRDLHAENGLMGLDEDLIRQAAVQAIMHNNGIVGVIGKDPIEAMIYLGLRQYWYTKDVHLEEMLAYVRPDHRRSKNAIALIEFAKSASLSLGIPLLIGIVSNEKTTQKIRLYERRLGKQSGAYFVYNGHTGKG